MFHAKKIYFTPDLKISDILPDNPYLLLFLEHFGIELPVHDKSLKTICEEHNLSPQLILAFANLYSGVQDTRGMTLSFDDTKAVILYLKNSHKFYSDEIYPEIRNTIRQMAEVNNSREMALVTRFFNDYFKEVTEHLNYENNVVFPYVLDLHEQVQQRRKVSKSKEYSVTEYREQHDDIEEKLDDLKQLLIKYLPRKNDKIFRRKLILSLFELEYDLNVHSQIEELILIPLVEKMESHLKKEP